MNTLSQQAHSFAVTPLSVEETNVIGACPHDCPDTCSLISTVKNGVVTKVHGNPDHPLTHGVLCHKVSRYTERTYHPKRILHPLKRSGAKGSGEFVRVSWDEALSDIAAKLRQIHARGAEAQQALSPYSYAGTMGKVQGEGMAARFFHQFGASLLERTICSTAGGKALEYTLGGKTGMRVQNFADSRLIIIWGSNSITSNLHFWRLAQEAKRKGATLICIDPRKTETAEKCHQHIALQPGTDAALALAIMHELIKHDWLDHDYIEKYTVGFEALKARALQWTPERAAEICGISVREIVELAAVYGQGCLRGDAVAIRLNYGAQRVHGGGNAVRAVASLPALTGAWRNRSGGVLLSSSLAFGKTPAALERADLLGARKPRTINMSGIGDALLNKGGDSFGPAVEAVIVYNSNPVAIAPDSRKVVQGFAREDLFTVVLEHFQTDTADYADYILPATTQLEHWDVHSSYGHTDVLLNKPAIAPVGEALPNTEIFRRLARAMGWNDAHFADDDLTLARTAVGNKVDFDELLQNGFAHLPFPDAPYANGNFPTPSGKCEFFSQRLADMGQDGLPDYVANYEVPNPAGPYPLAMISPPARNFLNSSFVNIESLAAMEREPLLEIHPVDASARGIQNGDTVRAFNDRGEYVCKADVSLRARAGVVNGLGVWWRKMGMRGTNVNELTSQRLTDIGAGPTFYDCAVQVERVQ